MKISWPWQRNKPFSVFESRVPRTSTSADHQRISSEHAPDQPHRMNAPGPFHVINQDCMTCGYPHVLTPNLMAWEMDSEGREAHCYFHKQPQTSQEIEQAVNAVKGSCCGALRYAGSDREILKRLS
jgi:hypothetical protein